MFKTQIILCLVVAHFFMHSCSTTLIDQDGKSYKTIRVSEQVWMAENLNVSKFRNGDTIPEAIRSEDWINAGRKNEPAWCYYNNDPDSGKKYGKLYNWFAVNDPRGLAPEGWHVPSDAEWSELIDYIGGEDIAGKKMKSTIGWNGGGNGTDKSGLSILPAGNRASSGNFNFTGLCGFFWCTTEELITTEIWIHYLYYGSDNVIRYHGNKLKGLSVRCLKN
jgi:uncharacterized protein (TIGR02145 family)